mgnify:CR=1 FL=1
MDSISDYNKFLEYIIRLGNKAYELIRKYKNEGGNISLSESYLQQTVEIYDEGGLISILRFRTLPTIKVIRDNPLNKRLILEGFCPIK